MKEPLLFDENDLKPCEKIKDEFINYDYINFLKKYGEAIKKQENEHKNWIKNIPKDLLK